MTESDLGRGVWDLGFPNLLAMGAPAQGAASPWLQFIPFVLVLAIFYFVILLPMKRRQQKVQAFLSALKVNDRVITSGGIFGTITKVNDNSIQLQIANNVRIEVSRAAVVGYQGQEPVGEGLGDGNRDSLSLGGKQP
jgi:preprotein translocase subunit YajC